MSAFFFFFCLMLDACSVNSRLCSTPVCKLHPTNFRKKEKGSRKAALVDEPLTSSLDYGLIVQTNTLKMADNWNDLDRGDFTKLLSFFLHVSMIIVIRNCYTCFILLSSWRCVQIFMTISVKQHWAVISFSYTPAVHGRFDLIKSVCKFG